MNKNIIHDAEVFATAAHAAVGQFRKYPNPDGTFDPYIVHPQAVAQMATMLDMNSYAIAACFLHDVLEDTKISIDDLKKMFGAQVTRLVLQLTDCPKTDGNRAFRKNKDKERLALADIDSQTIKCLDIRHNDKSITLSEDAFRILWKKEKAELIPVLNRADPIAIELLKQPLEWTLLDDLKFIQMEQLKRVTGNIGTAQ